MNRDSPWDIPELRTHLAQFLDKSQLNAATAVCKSWNKTFTPFLYSGLNWRHTDGHPRYPSKQTMQKYASHIRSIYFDFYVYELAKRLPWEAMTQIQEIHMTEEIKGDDIQERVVHLIERNRGLCKVVFHSSKIATTRKQDDSTATGHRHSASRAYDLRKGDCYSQFIGQLDTISVHDGA
ncbi:hypothetical protein BGZ79_010554 [Entomortierella chlamydospora]|nr:hypothetical protein BGZ79_010554 [Entomortierella chlamydospora]